jgi:hypothetical protein
MRVTFEHREARTGLFDRMRIYFIDCHIEFSEEERTIIDTRKLYSHTIEAGPSKPLSPFEPAMQRPVAVIVCVAGFIAINVSALPDFFRFLGLFAFVGAPLWFLYTYYAGHKVRSEQSESINLRQLLNKKGFTIYAYSPSAAKEQEAKIHEQLANLKQFLMNSATVGKRQTYEL